MKTRYLPEENGIKKLPVSLRGKVATAALPANYERAKSALEACASIDECQEWSSKADAIASYARQIKDDALRDSAKRISLRARVRLGELLSEYSAKRGYGSGTLKSERALIAAQHGIALHTATALTSMANVPKPYRESRIEASPPIRATDLADMGRSTYRGTNQKGRTAFSDTCRELVGNKTSSNQLGLHAICHWMRGKSAKDMGIRITSDSEKRQIRTYLIEISEWCDQLDRFLPKGVGR